MSQTKKIPVIRIDGVKGGVGKSLNTQILIHNLTSASPANIVGVIEGDVVNRDVVAAYGKTPNVFFVETLMTGVNYLEALFASVSFLVSKKCTHILINCPAGSSIDSEVELPLLQQSYNDLVAALDTLNCQLTTVFVAGNEAVSVVNLTKFITIESCSNIVLVSNYRGSKPYPILETYVSNAPFKGVVDMPLFDEAFITPIQQQTHSVTSSLSNLATVNALKFIRVNRELMNFSTAILNFCCKEETAPAQVTKTATRVDDAPVPTDEPQVSV